MSRMLSLEAVQRAVYTLLDGAVSVPVYDEPPQNTEMPYVTFHSADEHPRNTFGRRGRTVHVRLMVWTRSGTDFDQEGYAQALGIAGELDVLLDDATLDLSPDWTMVLCDLVSAQPVRDSDPSIRRVLATYRVFTEAAA